MFYIYIFVGCGLFASYYNSKDLTNAVFCTYNDEMCYRTGDLAWLNTTNGQLEYRGCRADQLELRSHSIDFDDVRSILKEIATDCVVAKSKHFNFDYVVAHVETKYSVKELRQHCLSRLPSYLIPSVFIIVNDLPANQSGRKNIPLSDLSSLLVVSNTEKRPRTEMEERLRDIWYQALPHINFITSTWKSIFSLSDDPGSFAGLLNLYLIYFKQSVQLMKFLKHPTIFEHARLLYEDSSIATSLRNQSQSDAISEGKYHLQLYSDDSELSNHLSFIVLLHMRTSE